MQQITANVDTSAVLERLGVGRNEELRQSNRRRRYLEKLSRVITPERPTVRLDPDHPTACVNQEKDKPAIRITTREFEQTATNLSRDVYDMTIQEALLIHEVGHVLYTDHGAFQRTLSRVDLQYKGAYKRLWNSLEDGAIEEQLRRRFNVEDEIFVANANIMGDKVEDDADSDGLQSREVDLYGAVTIGCLDLAVYDSGKFGRLRDPDDSSLTMRSEVERELLEELVPILKDAVADVVTEPDPVTRTERIYDFWCEVRDRLDQAEDEGEDQDDAKNTGGDDSQQGDGDGEGQGLGDLFGGDESGDEGDEGDGEGQTITVMPVAKPDDTENADIGGGGQADELDQQDEEEVEADLDAVADPEQDSPDQQAGDEEDDGDDGAGAGGDESDDREDDIEETRRGQLREEAQEVDGAQQLMDEIEEYSDAMEDLDQSGNYQGNVTLQVPGERDLDDRTRWNAAQRRSRQVAQYLRQSLREERRSRRFKNQRRGRFDRNRMVAADRGSARVFENVEEGDEKDYDCMMVLDRSGSMGGDRIELAEDAITALALGLEEVSVGVSVLGMLSNDANLENAFGRDVENDKGMLLSQRTSGATPLSQTLALGRKRMEQKAESDNRFMIVVTDGKPDNSEAYRNELDKCTFPVLGVYVETGADDSDLFHRQVQVESGDIEEAITRLARQAMM
jgi:Mg-chelatase subunit ChlD